MWQAMRFLGYDEKLIRILEALYKDTTCARVDGELTDWFTTVGGVLQGCVLSPLLFNILLEVVMVLALLDHELGAQDFRNTHIEPTFCRCKISA